MAKLREEQGLRAQPPMRHFVFSGPPGTGKTSVARVLGRVFAALGLLTRSEVVEAQRSDLVGEHLGATAIKTNALVDRALGGVLFIDEAYALTRAAGAADAEERLPRALAKELPNFMQPQIIHWRETLPVNPNGKLDRAAIAHELTA